VRTRILGRLGVDNDLLKAKSQDALRVGDTANAATVAERHEALFGDVREQRQVRRPAGRRSQDIEEHQLVDFQLVENAYGVTRVADVGEAAEARGFDQALLAQQQRRNHAGTQHHNLAKLLRKAMP
jgi:hypothetical protein